MILVAHYPSTVPVTSRSDPSIAWLRPSAAQPVPSPSAATPLHQDSDKLHVTIFHAMAARDHSHTRSNPDPVPAFRPDPVPAFPPLILSPHSPHSLRIPLRSLQPQGENAGTGSVVDKALQFRARQNVIFERGFFFGSLGWENVFVLFKPSTKVFRNFERPEC